MQIQATLIILSLTISLISVALRKFPTNKPLGFIIFLHVVGH